MTGAPRRLAITAGLHGSASTWVFNVVRELMAEAAVVHPCHATGPEDLRGLSGAVVAKTHGWPGLAGFAREQGAGLIVSVRDPRDAVLSLAQRFGETLDRAVAGVARDCRAALECAEAGFPVLRYEDRFFERPATVAALAGCLGLAVSGAAAARIFQSYTTEATRALAAGVTALPPERLAGGGSMRFDRITQITSTHIGDGRSGKWREAFTSDQQARLTLLFQPFLARFGYARLRIAKPAAATSSSALPTDLNKVT